MKRAVRRNTMVFIAVVMFICVIVIVLQNFSSLENIVGHKNQPSCKDCNIVFISLDTCGAKRMSCGGSLRDTTPNLCQFGEENTLFTHAYSNATWTLPSHVSMFTGLYPSHHQVNTSNQDILNSNIPFLPEILQEHGYETLLFMPQDDFSLPIDKVYNRGITSIISDGYGTPEYFKQALDRLVQNNKEKKKTFIFFHTYACHSPYVIEGNIKKYTNDFIPSIPITSEDVFYPFTKGFYEMLLTWLSDDALRGRWNDKEINITRLYQMLQSASGFEDAKRRFPEFVSRAELSFNELKVFYEQYYYWNTIDGNDKRQTEYIQALYDQNLYSLDATLGVSLQEYFHTEGLKDNTIVIVTADHGEEFGEHGSLGHQTVYDTILQVPLMIHIPYGSPRRVEENVQSVDLVPTIMDVLGIPQSYKMDGISVLPLLVGNLIHSRVSIADEIDESTHIKVFREGDWKVLTKQYDGSFFPYALYNTRGDPSENNNLIGINMSRVASIIKQYIKETGEVIPFSISGKF